MGGNSAEDPGSTGKGPSAPRDRRATNRAAIGIPAILHVGSREVACSVRDVSTRGISLHLNESVAPGMVVRVGFRLPTAGQPLEVTGVVVRSAGSRQRTTLGLQFVEAPADVVRAIGTFVARNRSDEPFSRRRKDAPDTAGDDAGEAAASLEGLYRQAVDEVAEKSGPRRGLLARWLRRDKA